MNFIDNFCNGIQVTKERTITKTTPKQLATKGKFEISRKL